MSKNPANWRDVCHFCARVVFLPTVGDGHPTLEIGSCYNKPVGVSKNSGTPKWMVLLMENPIKMDDLGVPPFSETPI